MKNLADLADFADMCPTMAVTAAYYSLDKLLTTSVISCDSCLLLPRQAAYYFSYKLWPLLTTP